MRMDVVTTSLEALIQRVTNPQNHKPDKAAIEAFCVMLTKESDGIQIGSKLLASRIQSSDQAEALQALTLLDTCMRRCGSSFHAEIGKFRFLNEMIRLVSPKYLGGRTPQAVRHKVLQLLYAWTKEYPRELKIKEAYDMLKKQGVIEDDPMSTFDSTDDGGPKISKNKHTIFDDEEKSKLLQKLLRSKNSDDLQAANRLIKTMVKEDERRVQLNSRRIMALESVHNNAKLLSEMLDSYNQDETSAEDLELMKELHQACERLKPILLRLANETQDNEEMLGDVLAASDELGGVFEKYTAVIVHGEPAKAPRTDSNIGPSLLDLSSPTESILFESEGSVNTTYDATITNHRTDMEILGDIFSSLEKSAAQASPVPVSSILIPDSVGPIVGQSMSTLPDNKKGETISSPEKKLDGKTRALEELNELGESLLKQSLSNTMLSSRSSAGCKQTIGRSLKVESLAEQYDSTTSRNFVSPGCPVDGLPDDRSNNSNRISDKTNDAVTDSPRDRNSFDVGANSKACDERFINSDNIAPKAHTKSTSVVNVVEQEPEIKPLTDMNVNLGDIRPGTNPPITVIEEKNGISVVLHFAQDSPRPDVFVVVFTTMSKNSKPLSNYLFQAVVPKRCKCRLQAPSGTELPAHNPFLPPSAITQIMLIANPNEEPVSLKFMLSYTMDDETFTEMGEVEQLPRP